MSVEQQRIEFERIKRRAEMNLDRLALGLGNGERVDLSDLVQALVLAGSSINRFTPNEKDPAPPATPPASAADAMKQLRKNAEKALSHWIHLLAIGRGREVLISDLMSTLAVCGHDLTWLEDRLREEIGEREPALVDT